VLVVVPVHSSSPEHWTVLTASREAHPGAKFQLSYYEPLPRPSKAATQAAKDLADLLLATAGEPLQLLPARSNQLQQTDGWSCGLWALKHSEKAVREQLLRLSPEAAGQPILPVLARLNKWIQAVLAKKNAGKQPDLPAHPPPLPPPADPPPAEGEEAALTGKQKPGSAKAHTGTWGCPKCRGNDAGCGQCNPAKVLRAIARKEAAARKVERQDL
jgi:hypothetical protein